ncbi:MAG: MBL fold metallo-hydrolase [Calditrichaeota bacterium]|nr:MBL fold metallo-hydrolase [Calditrichota bacterium]
MRFCILASGSRGNSVFIESDYARVLVDVGLSARQIELRLRGIGVDPSSIDAIVLTHDHTDHVRGVGVFARRFGVPIYGHPDTLDNITYLLRNQETIQPWHREFFIKDLGFWPFPLPHDSYPTVGYLVEHHQRYLAICTDLGVATEEVKQHLQEANAILLESNHDPEMLLNGPYPWHLKERIASHVGHLSNHNAGELLNAVLHPGVQQVILGHLSEENNTAQLALQTVLEYLPTTVHDQVTVIEQRQVSPVFQL